MKIDGHGKASVLTPKQMRLLFSEGFKCARDKALFGICLYTACRISEALQLRVCDITTTTIVFRKGNTKGNLATREVKIVRPLALLLAKYDHPHKVRYFPGNRTSSDYLSRATADRILRDACQRLGFEGVSTHSFRRTALTRMSASGVPLRVIQTIGGHTDLAQLSAYLEVTDLDVSKAVETICF